MNAPAEVPARTARIERNTAETRIAVVLDLDGTGRAELATGVPFLDHMLDQLARHGMVDLAVRATGDLHIDAHHTVEDIGITLGQALRAAVGDKKVHMGVKRPSRKIKQKHSTSNAETGCTKPGSIDGKLSFTRPL